MLGYVTTSGRGASDRLLAAVAERLIADGMRVTGAVQMNVERGLGLPCDMDLCLLTSSEQVRISQFLGPLARGCRLDPAGLETMVGLVERSLEVSSQESPHLLIVNKFGKQEIDGRGFRPVIGRALSDGIPVLTAVNARNLPEFGAFSEGAAEQVPAALEPALQWCRNAASSR